MQTANSAEQLLRKAEEIMAERGKQYDSTGQNRERSMGRIVAAFNCLYGTSLTEQQGWYFMLLVKLARQETKPHADSMEDAIAYAALAGEAGFTQLGAMPTPQHLQQQQQQDTVLANYEATAQELMTELEQARSEIFSLEQALRHSIEQRDSLHEQVLEATASADKWHDKAISLKNSLRISEQAAQAKIQQLTNALHEANANAANVNALQNVEHCRVCGLHCKQSVITFGQHRE